jgi:hypothetical protein
MKFSLEIAGKFFNLGHYLIDLAITPARKLHVDIFSLKGDVCSIGNAEVDETLFGCRPVD